MGLESYVQAVIGRHAMAALYGVSPFVLHDVIISLFPHYGKWPQYCNSIMVLKSRHPTHASKYRTSNSSGLKSVTGLRSAARRSLPATARSTRTFLKVDTLLPFYHVTSFATFGTCIPVLHARQFEIGSVADLCSAVRRSSPATVRSAFTFLNVDTVLPFYHVTSFSTFGTCIQALHAK